MNDENLDPDEVESILRANKNTLRDSPWWLLEKLRITEEIAWRGVLLSASWTFAYMISYNSGLSARSPTSLLVLLSLVAFAVIHNTCREAVDRDVRRLWSKRGFVKLVVLTVAWGFIWFEWFEPRKTEGWWVLVFAPIAIFMIVATFWSLFDERLS